MPFDKFRPSVLTVVIKTQERFHTVSLTQTPVLFTTTNEKASVCVAESSGQKNTITPHTTFSQILGNGELSGSV